MTTKNRICRGKKLVLILLLAAVTVAFASCGKDNAPQQTEERTTASETTQQTSAPASSEPLATVVFASDWQQQTGWDAPGDTFAAILRAAGEDGKSPDGLVICGDYTNDRNLHDYQLSPEESIARAREIAKENCPDLSDESMLFTQGNHDQLTESIATSGLHDCGDYLVYVLNTQNDFPWKQGKEAGCLDKVKKASEDMKACFDGLIAKGEKRPVFIAGHVPLHFTARTSSRHTTGDNLYSSLIFEKVNEASKDLDIVYFFGHNHSKGWDCYMGGSSVYKAKGDRVLIPEFDKDDRTSDRFREEVLRFTYLNAGYLGYYMNCGPEEVDAGTADQYAAADNTLTATVCQVYPDRLVLSRYAAGGLHPLGWAGEGDPYKGGIDSGLIGEEYYSRQTDSPREILRRP